MGLSIRTSGSFDKTDRFLLRMLHGEQYRNLDQLAQAGVDALAGATPQDTGLTAASWGYRIVVERGGAKITWFNRNLHEGVPIAVILQYGHGTGTGGYVQGRDYINPAIRPIFDRIAESVWQEVRSLWRASTTALSRWSSRAQDFSVALRQLYLHWRH